MAIMSHSAKLRSWRLHQPDFHDQLIVVTCRRCKTTHRYVPAVLIRLRGDMDLLRLLRLFRCARHGDGAMIMDVEEPPPEERKKLVIRRLADIQIRKVPIWRDGHG